MSNKGTAVVVASENGIEGKRAALFDEKALQARLPGKCALQLVGREPLGSKHPREALGLEECSASAVCAVLEEDNEHVAARHESHRAAAEITPAFWQDEVGRVHQQVGT